MQLQDSSNNDTGDYALTINADDTIGSTIDTQEVLDPGQTLDSALDVFGDIDVIKTGLTKGLSYGFEVSTADEQLDLSVLIKNTNGGNVASGSASNGDPVVLSYTATQSNDHFVQIQDSSNNDTGDYSLTVKADDTIVNSLDTDVELSDEEDLTSAIDVNGDTDVLKTMLTKGLAYGFEVSTNDAEIDLNVLLKNAVGGNVSSGSGSNGGSVFINYTATQSQDHFLLIQDSSNNDTGDFTVSMNAEDTIVNSLDTDEFLIAGQSLTSAIDVDGDLDVIKTLLNKGLTYGFELSTNDTEIDLNMLLQNAVGGNVASDSELNGATAAFSYTANQSSEHFVQIQDSSNNNTGDYTLATNADDNIVNSRETTVNLPVGTCLNSFIDVVSDVDVIAIDLVAGFTYDFTVTTTSGVLDLSALLMNGIGGNVASDNGSNGEALDFSYTAVATETHYISISDSSNNDVGKYTVLVTSNGLDFLNGGGGPNELHGGKGADTLFGFAGEDTLFGGDDDDVIDGGGQRDTIDGGAGDDDVRGGTGRDYVDLGDGNDLFTDEDQGGTNGRDTILGGEGNDTILGGGGKDRILGGDGADLLEGGADDDVIRGGDQRDTIDGGTGDDVVSGGRGRDLITLGDGDDTFLDSNQTGPTGRDTVDGGAGLDTFVAGGGDDVFTGGADADRFVFAGEFEIDVITDFQDGLDVIDFTLWTDVTALADLTVQNGAQGAEIFKTGDATNMVILEGVAMSVVDDTDFDFV